jgi:hypothetical protein
VKIHDKLLLNPKFQAPPDLKIGPNKSQIPVFNDQNIGIKWNLRFNSSS